MDGELAKQKLMLIKPPAVNPSAGMNKPAAQGGPRDAKRSILPQMTHELRGLVDNNGIYKPQKEDKYLTVKSSVYIRINSFRLTYPMKDIFIYDVALTEGVKPISNPEKLRAIFATLKEYTHREFNVDPNEWATDLRAVFSVKKPFNEKVKIIKGPGYGSMNGQDKNLNDFAISYRDTINHAKLKAFSDSFNNSFNFTEAATALNAFISKFPCQFDNVIPVGRNKYIPLVEDPKFKQELSRLFFARKGIFSSAYCGFSGLLVNVNPIVHIFFHNIPLVNVIKEYCALGNVDGRTALKEG
ncbi:MAG: hypothetical protein M1834_002248 [Cirrosporium novae-zelandiae]|nr:MAG: hypothetical protein M1834_002248 [Cirrosporium novae-zelandiae]